MSGADYTHDGQQRILRLVMLLAGNEVHGLAPSHIARVQECNASMVTRDLANLQTAGWAERVRDSDNWRLAPQVVQLSVRHATALARAEDELRETRNRFSRT